MILCCVGKRAWIRSIIAFYVRISGAHSVFFFFSSRRRHTRFDCDWSSDVCSSDLPHILEIHRPLEDVQAPRSNFLSPISWCHEKRGGAYRAVSSKTQVACPFHDKPRSEEHTSELQSQSNLVCRLLLAKKKILSSIQ